MKDEKTREPKQRAENSVTVYRSQDFEPRLKGSGIFSEAQPTAEKEAMFEGKVSAEEVVGDKVGAPTLAAKRWKIEKSVVNVSGLFWGRRPRGEKTSPQKKKLGRKRVNKVLVQRMKPRCHDQ